MYIVIEMASVELLGIEAYRTRRKAEEAFAAICADGKLGQYGSWELGNEVDGTLALAGDDAHSVQLIERKVDRKNENKTRKISKGAQD